MYTANNRPGALRLFGIIFLGMSLRVLVGAARVLIILSLGFAAGLLSGLLGVGGGVLLLPAVACLFGLNRLRAAATSLVVTAVAAAAACVPYSRGGHVDWLAAAALAVGGVIGAGLGGRVLRSVRIERLRPYFGLGGLLVGLGMAYGDWGARLSPAGDLWMVPVGAAAGAVSGLFGAGGGIVLVPVLVLLAGFSQTAAQGVSLAVIIPASAVGALIHIGRRNVDAGLAPWLILGGLAGGVYGAHLALDLSPHTLRSLFGLFLAVSGAFTIVGSRSAARE